MAACIYRLYIDPLKDDWTKHLPYYQRKGGYVFTPFICLSLILFTND